MSEYNNTPDGFLVRLKNLICLKLGIDNNKLKYLIEKFIRSNVYLNTPGKLNYTKSNTFTELNKPSMSIKVFFKFLRIIGVRRFKMTLDLEMLNSRKLTVEETVNFTTGNLEKENDDENQNY